MKGKLLTMNIIKRLGLILAAVMLLGAILVPVKALASNADDVCKGLELTGGTCGTPSTGPSVDSTVKLVINILSLIVGVISVIMIIVGGLKYITSQGESSNTAGAKNTILYAIIGLVIVALAQIIVAFVLTRVKDTGTAKPPCSSSVTTNCTPATP